MGKRKATCYYVYLLLCEDGSYYTGYTTNVASRLERHEKGHGARYTRIRKPKRVVYVERFGNRTAAMRRERELKKLSHERKQRLATSEMNRFHTHRGALSRRRRLTCDG